jgi:Protein of unknown function (DUF1566)
MNTKCRAAMMLMIAVLALGAGMASAQSDEGPILLPKPKPKPAAMLLVACDLACNWTLDGEAQGRIAAGGSAKMKVELGEHIVIAVTEDGLDKVQQLTEVKAAGQKVVSLALQPVRDARLKAKQQARDNDARAEAAGLIWTDPATGLMWTKKDNGSKVNWQEAVNYCQNLQLAGHSDWRLPAIDELQGIYDKNANVGGLHVKGNLQLTDWQWSSSEENASAGAWVAAFGGRDYFSTQFALSSFERALCVRRSGE